MYVYISRALRAPCNLRSDPERCLAASTFAPLPVCPLSLLEWPCITSGFVKLWSRSLAPAGCAVHRDLPV